MMKKMGTTALMLALVGASAISSGCGGVSDAKKQDVANVAGGMNSFAKTSLQGDTSAQDLAALPAAYSGAYWWARFAAEAAAQDAAKNALRDGTSGLTLSSCPYTGSAATATVNGVSCTLSCPTLSQISVKCTLPDGNKESCGGTVYSFSAASVTVTTDLTNFTVNNTTGSISGSIGVSMGLQANITGGNLDGKTLACSLNVTESMSATSATTAPSVGCDNFSCTWDGKSISCADFQSKAGATQCKPST